MFKPDQHGWIKMRNSDQLHYIEPSGRSACRRFLYFGRAVGTPKDFKHPLNCETCRERLRSETE